MRAWSLETLRPVTQRRLHPAAAGVLHLRAFRSAGELTLATQGRDGMTRLWRCNEEDGGVGE